MRALYKTPGTPSFRQLLVPNDLHTLQDLVGGYIETVTAGVDPKVVLICNEEGIPQGMPFNCIIACGDDKGTFDCPFYGPVLLVGADGDEFTDVPISVVMANNMIVREDMEPGIVPVKEQKPKPENKQEPKKTGKEFDIGKAKALREGGWTLAGIAKELGCSQQTVANQLHKAGVK